VRSLKTHQTLSFPLSLRPMRMAPHFIDLVNRFMKQLSFLFVSLSFLAEFLPSFSFFHTSYSNFQDHSGGEAFNCSTASDLRPGSRADWNKEAFYHSAESGTLIKVIPKLHSLPLDHQAPEVYYSHDDKSYCLPLLKSAALRGSVVYGRYGSTLC
jgi:hypothetical protein